jgi:hypothetical protein
MHGMPGRRHSFLCAAAIYFCNQSPANADAPRPCVVRYRWCASKGASLQTFLIWAESDPRNCKFAMIVTLTL